jgi:hypothetical protein
MTVVDQIENTPRNTIAAARVTPIRKSTLIVISTCWSVHRRALAILDSSCNAVVNHLNTDCEQGDAKDDSQHR